jgi:hypothetical protein
MENDSNPNIVDDNHNKYYNRVELDLRDMARNQDSVTRFNNNFQMNLISRQIQSPFLDCFEGTLMGYLTFNYLSTNRDMSLRDLLKNHRGQEVVAW